MRAWLLCVSVWASCAAAAQPRVVVRSETRIELRTTRSESGVSVSGVLRDDLGLPLADREVILGLRAAPRGALARQAVASDAQGRFEREWALQPGAYQLSAAFGGDGLHERVEVERPLDLDRADVRLRVSVPGAGRLDLDEPSHRLRIAAESAAGGGGLEIEVLDELDRPLASGTTDPSGGLLLALPSTSLGAPGAGRLRARSLADAARAEAQTEVPVVRFRRTFVSLAAERTRVTAGARVRLAGTLADRSGPLEGLAIGLFADERHLDTVLTGAGGHFVREIELEPGLAGSVTLVARFESDSPGRMASESSPVAVDVRTPLVGAWAWALLPAGVCALILLGIARRTPSPRAQGVSQHAPRPAGVHRAQRRARRAAQTDVGGRVVDRGTDEPVAGAVVRLSGVPDALLTDAAGVFQVSRAPAGRHRMTVEARGFASVEAALEVPHRGEWSATEVRLESLRAIALAPFRAVATALLRSAGTWPIWTNREIVRDARARGVAPATLAALERRVEIAVYGGDPPEPGELDRIGALGRAAAGELPRPGGAAANGAAPDERGPTGPR